MKFTRKSSGYNWTDYKINTKVLNELNISSIIGKINAHKTIDKQRE